MRKKLNYTKKKSDFMARTALLLISIAVILLFFSMVLKIPTFRMWYEQYQHFLDNLEMRFASLGGKWIVMVSIFFLFTVKSVFTIPIFPISCVCVISSMVFSTGVSLLVNISGFVLMFSLRYYIGRDRQTLTYKFLRHYDEIWKFIKKDSKGNPLVLFVCRAIPLFPINTVSNIYGGLRYDFFSYLLISLIGFMPKIISYTIIGRNVFDPFSASFVIPLMFSCLFSGAGLLITRRIILLIRKKGEEDVKI